MQFIDLGGVSPARDWTSWRAHSEMVPIRCSARRGLEGSEERALQLPELGVRAVQGQGEREEGGFIL